MNKSLKLLILVSVLLNMLLIGAIGGYTLKRWLDPAFPPPPPGHFMAGHPPHPATSAATVATPALDALPEASRQKLKEEMDALFKSHHSQWQEAKELRKELRNVLTSEEFDAEAYAEKMELMHELRGSIMQDFTNKVAALADGLSVDERRALAEMLRRPMKRHGCSAMKPGDVPAGPSPHEQGQEMPPPHPHP